MTVRRRLPPGSRPAADRIAGEIAQMLGGGPPTPPDGPGVSEAAAGLLQAVAGRRWLDVAAAARRTGLAPATLAAYRRQGTGPPFRRFGGRVRYPEDTLQTWLEAQAATQRVGRPPADRRCGPHFG